jgi:2-dehydro-3-deoxy-D-arabinonate dehydratase
MTTPLKLFRTRGGWVADSPAGRRVSVPAAEAGSLTTREDLGAYLSSLIEAAHAAADAPLDPSGGQRPPGDLLAPIERQEVWAAGVTYFRSRTARMEESKAATGGSFYDLVYNAERPELFFKAPAWRVVAPGAAVRIRADATWNVPEPEFALLISPGGRILGYTIGNDMSSRDIEGANPLYLPQAKVYDGSCAIGPAILVTSEPLARSTPIRIEIARGGTVVFSGATSVSDMKRDFETLVAYLYKELSFPDGAVLLTGTGIIPPDEFTLHAGDDIRITIEDVGTLHNTVA